MSPGEKGSMRKEIRRDRLKSGSIFINGKIRDLIIGGMPEEIGMKGSRSKVRGPDISPGR